MSTSIFYIVALTSYGRVWLVGHVAGGKLVYPLDPDGHAGYLVSSIAAAEKVGDSDYFLQTEVGPVAFLPDYPLHCAGRDHVPEGERLYFLRLGRLLYDKKIYPSGSDGQAASFLVEETKNGDMLVLRGSPLHPPERIFEVGYEADSVTVERFLYTFQRVGLVPHFFISEEREADLFNGIDECLIKII